ncbi:SIS domain-containing protein [Massilia varians]|jgi:D-sedoheptulose 7-phosphate isomerase|uniref:SIS domain-containing protein n=2 Tax=Massilia TaxID=149698 RepID=A0ABT2ARZ4_9BURK|nr:SIS domain-containing protein [Massilia agri]MCS0599019.1 SIS domain-containing protein [Massilia agri]QOY92547.1 SIS domain-containing protein [Massilia sp. UMI-21]
MIDHIRNNLVEARDALDRLISDDAQLGNIQAGANLLVDALGSGHRVISCGNGGSMCDAMHLAEELSGRFREDRPAMAAVAISDPSYISCVANDYGYEQVFARFVEGNGAAGDVLFAISTSGSSRSVILAAQAARAKGMKVIGLTGRPGAALAESSDVCICTSAGRYADRVQELHIKVIHILIELVERTLQPANYVVKP